MNTETFWGRVKSLIKAHKLSQAEFANHISINPPTFMGWIYHDRMPDIETALYMAAALGVSLEYLIFGADGKATETRMQQTEERKNAALRIQKLNDEIGKEIQYL
ncbi:MAG: helix-turn-helix domain-containing protein [Treponema sp.]|nr:helix-turn-helix domain-containing protein [Treponema sp.]